MKKRTVALLMAVVMLFGAAVGGTIAWLTAETDEVVNTFTVGDINIELDETDVDNSTEGKDRDKANEYKLIPGTTYVKDPIVRVLPNSEKSYVFIQIEEKNNVIDETTIIEFTKNTTGWTPYAAGTNENAGVYVYYQIVNATDKDTTWSSESLLTEYTKQGTDPVEKYNITINDELTKTQLETINGLAADAKPELVFKACAIQFDNLGVDEAWGLANPLLNPPVNP